ncbi:hypothetical protein D3C71_1338130 [compost metagenome]
MGQHVEILGDTLVRVIDDLLLFGMVIRLMRQPFTHEFFGHPAPPVHLQALCQVNFKHRQYDENQRQIGKAPQLRLEYRVIFILQRVVKHLVPLVDQHADVHQPQ